MNTISYLWTDGNNKEFQSFYQKTEEYYNKIVGGFENRKGFVPHNLSDKIEVVLLAYNEDKAVACAGLKRYSDTDVEIKRVWVEPEFRGNHIAQEMMEKIENKARKFGYKRTVLQTREIMKDAVGLYERIGYRRIENYPPYDTLPGAICMAKEL